MSPIQLPITTALETLKARGYVIGSITPDANGVLHVLVNEQWRSYAEVYALAAERVDPNASQG